MFNTVVMLIVLFPLFAAAANGINLVAGDRLWGWREVQKLTCLMLFASFAGSVWVFWQVLGDPTPREFIAYRWMSAGTLNVDVGFLIDSLSAVMMLVVTGFSFMIAVFSINYMHNDYSFTRYFSAMALFVFAMLVLVMGNNYIMLFLGWEAVGLCSYLLIGHYYDRKSASRAGTKAFVMNRVGDAGFLIGIFLIASNFGSVAYADVFANLSKIDTGTATAIGLCLLTGAIGKSAQLPLGTWLAKAMEGPTPSSALIHAATMVTAGVYMIARSHGIFDMAPAALAVVTLVGAVTAVYGATVGKTISDIKGILAASTTTQLGLMFVACGLGAYPVAIFHLVAHAFLKSFLFLTAPSILHYFHTFPEPGAIEAKSGPVPVVFWLVLVGCIGLIAFPFGAGLIGGTENTGLAASYYVLIAAGIMALFTTLYYAVSATQRIFSDHGHDGHDGHQHHDHNIPVAVPVISILSGAAIALLLGLLPGGLVNSWFAEFLSPVVSVSPTEASKSGWSFLVITSLGLLMLSAWAASIFMDRFRPEIPGSSLIRARIVYTAAMRRFWLDDFYHRVIVAGAVKLGSLLDRFDTNIIDRLVGAPATADRIRSASSTWETRYLAAKAAGVAGALGTLASAANVAPVHDARNESGSGGLLPWLTAASARSSVFVEQRFVAEGAGVAGALTSYASRTSALFEKDVIAQGQGLIGVATDGAAFISGWVEKNVFESGVNDGVSQTGGAAGSILYQIEELLGRPLIVGTTVLVAIFGLLWGVVS
jgi:NADH-quinone oxidoreductase subunit L